MQFSGKKVLVTGGAGFIGSTLVDHLLKEGAGVSVIDNLSTGNIQNLSHVKQDIDFVEGDIRNLDELVSMSAGCDVIFHQAAVVSVPQTVENPIESTMVNDIGTLHVLEAARINNVKRVVIASSCAVYGDDPELPKKEHMQPRPLTPYAVQKLTGEFHAKLYFELYGVETVCLRYFNVFGPRQDPSSPYSGVISIFITKASENHSPFIYGDGEQYRDFIFVKDIVKANLLAACSENCVGKVYNVGTGNTVSINNLWKVIAGFAGADKLPEYKDARAGDIKASVSDIGQAELDLGFKPDFSFEKGLKETFEWYQKS